MTLAEVQEAEHRCQVAQEEAGAAREQMEASSLLRDEAHRELQELSEKRRNNQVEAEAETERVTTELQRLKKVDWSVNKCREMPPEVGKVAH